VRVTFCVKDAKDNYRVTAYGNLTELEDGDRIGFHIGRELSFAIDREFDDVESFIERFPEGIVSATEKKEFYEFEVLSGSGKTGLLKILQPAKERSCLPPDAQ